NWRANPLVVNAYNHDVQQIVQQARDPQLIEAIILVFAKLLLTTGIALLISDMNSFTIVDEILAGNKVPWSHALNLLGYADVYLIVLLGVSVVIFDYREI